MADVLGACGGVRLGEGLNFAPPTPFAPPEPAAAPAPPMLAAAPVSPAPLAPTAPSSPKDSAKRAASSGVNRISFIATRRRNFLSNAA